MLVCLALLLLLLLSFQKFEGQKSMAGPLENYWGMHSKRHEPPTPVLPEESPSPSRKVSWICLRTLEKKIIPKRCFSKAQNKKSP